MNRLSAEELIQWQIFATREPLLAERIDIGIARLIHVLIAINSDKKSKRRKWTDFLIKWWPSKQKTPEELVEELIDATLAMNGTVAPEILEQYEYDTRRF